LKKLPWALSASRVVRIKAALGSSLDISCRKDDELTGAMSAGAMTWSAPHDRVTNLEPLSGRSMKSSELDWFATSRDFAKVMDSKTGS
jgi:hypothetical protein